MVNLNVVDFDEVNMDVVDFDEVDMDVVCLFQRNDKASYNIANNSISEPDPRTLGLVLHRGNLSN